MAERFGGKFSPDGSVSTEHGPATPTADGPHLNHPVGRHFLIYALTPLPFVIRAFGSPAHGLILGLSAAALLALAVWLTMQGQRAEDAYNARRVSRRPAFPRKIAASVLTGIALYLGGRLAAADTIHCLGFLVFGAGLHLAAFGPDPLKNKGMEGIDEFQTDRVARAVDEGEAYLAAMKDATLRAGDRAVDARVDKFAAAARAMFRTIEADPGDLTAARKYLSVYLMGARDASVKFADLYARTRDPATRAEYVALLDDLEAHFAARTDALLSNNRTDLDVEIEVLRERLLREG
jgi:5-bromo-4-chloroindolyl phosphate hydrolysis protein